MVLKDLIEAGFLINKEKSIFTPQSIIDFLGPELNFVEGTFNLPMSKRKAFRKEVGILPILRLAMPRKVASILRVIR